MNFKYLYTSFDGRINRKPFWLGAIGLFVVGLVLSLVVVGPLTAVSVSLGKILSLLLSLILLYPGIALCIKRLHDRDKPVGLVWVFIAPGLVYQVADLLGLATRTMSVQGQVVPVPTVIGTVLGLVSLVVGIWALITLGIRKGTAGPNPHGPDPLAADAPAP
ncbi:MAG: DUF805 domain-containing protein [Ottowia sp.]|nr:DUF805 domain-containing protein [Ottowia sp.]